eukprot:393779_1
MSEDVEMVKFDSTGIWCATTRLGKFFDVGWGDLVPPFTKLTGKDLDNFTIENLLKHRHGLYTTAAMYAFILVALIFAFIHDARMAWIKRKLKEEAPKNVVLTILKDESKGAVSKVSHIFTFRFKNEHKYASLVLRDRISYFKTAERVIVLTVYLTSVLASGAIFYRQKVNFMNWITVGVVS